MEQDQVCRLCGTLAGKNTRNIFNKSDEGQQILQLIKRNLPVLVYRTDPLSKEICEICYTKITEFNSFKDNCVKVHDDFRSDLENRRSESNVQLYLDTLENSCQPDLENIFKTPTSQPTKNNSCQVSMESTTNLENQKILCSVAPIKNLKILTPSKINEIVSPKDDNFNLNSGHSCILESLLVSSPPRKKRRLAGPKSKTKFLNIFRNPPSLLQCALKQINADLNPNSNSGFGIELNFERSEPEDMEIDSYEHLDYSSNQSPEMADVSIMEPKINISVFDTNFNPNFTDDSNDFTYDLTTPVVCNYCLKSCENILALAHHESTHINVQIGPKCDSKEYLIRYRKNYGFYMNYLQRLQQIEADQHTGCVENEVSSSIDEEELGNGDQIDQNDQNDQSVDPDQDQEEEEMDEKEEEENSLLVPEPCTSNCVFEIIDDEVVVNGRPLKSIDKTERRRYYKSMVINGVKRKFCPLCRHTFKDNWAIEMHYVNDVCQYTCRYCGRKFKFHSQLLREHLKQHRGEPNNKVFGPIDRRLKFKKKKKYSTSNRTILVSQTSASIPPKVKPIKMKHLLQRKLQSEPVKVKSEPLDQAENDVQQSSGGIEPYQAFFCRKCFKVFFKIDQYNSHIVKCTGSVVNLRNKNNLTQKLQQEMEVLPPEKETSNTSRRPQRSCVKEITSLQDRQDSDDNDVEYPAKKPVKNTEENGFECGICCSSFPSRHSRNSHMRIHKGQSKPSPTKVSPRNQPISAQMRQPMAMKSETFHTNNMTRSVRPSVAGNPHHSRSSPHPHPLPQPQPLPSTSPANDVRLANLNPTVARLVQNNPHLTIRSYSKHQPPPSQLQLPPDVALTRYEQFSETSSDADKKYYNCGDCKEKFENKSVLYYHKMNACIVKRHYECAFCKKKFGTYDQYNTHMYYVHPE